jgi:hypothetical protein
MRHQSALAGAQLGFIKRVGQRIQIALGVKVEIHDPAKPQLPGECCGAGILIDGVQIIGVPAACIQSAVSRKRQRH